MSRKRLVRFNPETQVVEMLRRGIWVPLPEADAPGEYATFAVPVDDAG